MKVLLIIISLYLLFFIPISFGNYDTGKKVTIKNKKYSFKYVYKKLDSIIDIKSKNSFRKKKTIYEKYIQGFNLRSDIDKDLINILEYGLSEVKRDIYNYENKINKVLLGYSSGGKEIIAYFRGLPEEGYFAIFGNIHGSYEYGSYETSIYLKDFLSNTDKKGWFIIPSLNPDGLYYFLKNGKTSSYYINGRSNLNNVDINRNFCTNNFSLGSYYKKGQKFLTGISGCNGELETKVILRTFEKYKFNSIISLHSQGKIFYIPDNSIDDERVLDLGYKLKDILPDYDFDPYYKNPEEKKEKIKAYEIDEGGIGLYTGTMETYIYEKYDIPVVLIEIYKHGKIEKRLKNIIKYLK